MHRLIQFCFSSSLLFVIFFIAHIAHPVRESRLLFIVIFNLDSVFFEKICLDLKDYKQRTRGTLCSCNQLFLLLNRTLKY